MPNRRQNRQNCENCHNTRFFIFNGRWLSLDIKVVSARQKFKSQTTCETGLITIVIALTEPSEFMEPKSQRPGKANIVVICDLNVTQKGTIFCSRFSLTRRFCQHVQTRPNENTPTRSVGSFTYYRSGNLYLIYYIRVYLYTLYFINKRVIY